MKAMNKITKIFCIIAEFGKKNNSKQKKLRLHIYDSKEHETDIVKEDSTHN